MAKFRVINKITKETEQYHDILINAQQWINDMLDPVNGIASTQELVGEYIPENRPMVDDRLINVVINGTNHDGAYADVIHPLYPELKQWLITYSLVDKTAEEKKLAVDEAEHAYNESIVPARVRLKDTILIVDNILDFLGLIDETTINATTLNNKKKKQLRIFKRTANKIRDNDKERDAKHALIDAGTNPNLEANWNINDYSENA